MKNLVVFALTDKRSRYYLLFAKIIAFFTVLSILAIVLETIPSLDRYSRVFWVIEWMSVAVFTAEYLVRLLVSKPKSKYVFSFYGVIDLISILPTFIGFANLTFLKSARAIRLIRLLRLVRLAKLRALKGRDVEHAFGIVQLNVTIYIIFLIIMLLLSGTVLYLFEPSNEAFTSIPEAMWWTFSVFTGDTPRVGLETAFGSSAYIVNRFIGLVLLGALIGVSANIMNYYLLERRK